ncbi:isochorismatase family protein [Terriglobus roseus]|uniref:Nicotinamidase-related amidase n=1 Tax=Terriglobus roseus TaxID=392734 RepID=A0A1H4KMF7_9BACT|nr:isochorismatase family protein [Terriglobus roseus]SEB59288.1 Nicotinamidase-related amidase [Terriglobus roseus]
MSDLKLDMSKTALVLIDLQNGVVGRDTKPYTAIDVVERAATLAEAFRAKGSPVVYVRVNMSDFMRLPSDEVMQLPKDIPAAASEIAVAAGMKAGDVLVTKRHWGAFAGTNLEEVLRSRGVKTVVLGGIATNIGVESTLRQGTGLGFAFVTVEDICTTFSPEMQSFAFTAIFPRLSNVSTTEKVIAAIG